MAKIIFLLQMFSAFGRKCPCGPGSFNPERAKGEDER
jgi:hypothetical protein